MSKSGKCTAYSNKVVVMSESDGVITTHTQIPEPQCLSVSNDNTIYLADRNTGVYQSTDDGISWKLVFKSTDGWHCWQVIKVTNNYRDDFWTLEESDDNCYQLGVYSKDRKYSDDNVTWRDIEVPTTDDKHIFLLYSSLSYDSDMNIFLSDYLNKAVHVFATNGQYRCQLLSSHHIQSDPVRLAVDREHKTLCVGKCKSVVTVFKLT